MPPKTSKRKAGAAGGAAGKKQPKQAGQKAIKKELNVPIDEGAALQGADPHVFIDDTDDVIFDASLNQSNVSNNNNKFYRLQLLAAGKGKNRKYHVWTRWGRVGEFGQSAMLGPFDLDEAKTEFDKKFKSKTGLAWENRADEPKKSKYTYIERSYDEDDGDQDDGDTKVKVKDEDEDEDIKSDLPMPTQRLLELIFNENHFNSVLENIGYNQDKLPLGKLGKSTIKKGFEHLKELSSLIRHPSLAQNKYQMSQKEVLEDFTNQYYSTIPHVFGRNRPPMIDNTDILQKEVAMLDTLTDMEVANQIMKTTSDRAKDKAQISMLDKRFAELKCDTLEAIDHKSSEYKEIQKYLLNTAGKTHNIRYRLQDIFRVERTGEDERFKKSGYDKRGDRCRRLLWHGSRTTNFGGILSQGLRIAPPEAPVNGYAFGKGVYLADVSTKSANYCQAGTSGNHGLLLLCEAELGNPMYELLGGDFNAEEDCKKAGRIATFGVGRTVPQGWVDAKCINDDLEGVLIPDTSKDPADQKQHPNAYLQYNEYICYDVKQIKIRYLLRFSL